MDPKPVFPKLGIFQFNDFSVVQPAVRKKKKKNHIRNTNALNVSNLVFK